LVFRYVHQPHNHHHRHLPPPHAADTIYDNDPVTNIYISVPTDYRRFNPAIFIAGIVRGVLDAAGFPCTVTAVIGDRAPELPREKTIFVVKFEDAPGA